MTAPRGGDPVSDGVREAAVDALAEAFAGDLIPLEEFERRVELAHRADTTAELRALLGDLPRGQELPAIRAGGMPAPGAAGSLEPSSGRRELATHVPDQAVVVGLMGAGVRKGRWHPARYNYAIGVMGGAELDFRECALPPVTDIRCFAIMGGVDIVVPPDVIVETSGVGIMGGFDHVAISDAAPEGAPIIRVTGLALMGGVTVKVRHPGESEGDARRRRRAERRDRRRGDPS